VRTRNCDPGVRTGRLRKATGFFDLAEDAAVLDDTGDANDGIVTMYVLAGIAAADTICCARLGMHAVGENHDEAIQLLRSAVGSDAKYLSTLLGLKTKAAYSHYSVSKADVTRASRAASVLVELAKAAD